MPDLDIADDAEIRRLADLARPLASYTKDEVVDNDDLRARVATEAGNALAAFAAGADVFGAGSLVRI